MPLFELDLAACRGRQQRLLNEMRARQIDLAIVTQLEHVQWLAGARLNWYFQPAAALTADGHLTLVAPVKWKGDAAADEVTPEPERVSVQTLGRTPQRLFWGALGVVVVVLLLLIARLVRSGPSAQETTSRDQHGSE